MSVVSWIYPSSCSLLAYLAKILPGRPQDAVLKDSDGELYRNLLRETLIVDTSPSHGLDLSQEPYGEKCSVKDVLNRAIPLILKSREANCLAFGYRQKAMYSEAIMRNHMNTECYFVNTIQSLLITPSWQLLVDRIGEGVFRHLITKKMFVRSGNGCYLQVSGSIHVDPPKPIADPSASRRIRGNSSIHRYRMLYNTRREGEAGLPRTFCFFKRSSEQVFLDIFGERWQRPDLLPLVADRLKSYCKGMIARYCAYDMHSASKRYCIRYASQPASPLPPSKKPRRQVQSPEGAPLPYSPTHGTVAAKAGVARQEEEEEEEEEEFAEQEQPPGGAAKKKRGKRGCRAGSLVQTRKRQRLARALDFQATTPCASSAAVGEESGPQPSERAPSTITVGDRLVQTWLHKLSAASQPLISQEVKDDVDLSGSTLASNSTSRRQRKRMNRKLRALLSSSRPNVQPPLDNNTQLCADSLALPANMSEGLRLHTSRPQPTYDIPQRPRPSSFSPELPPAADSPSPEVWERATHVECVCDLVKSVCRHVFSLETTWGSRHNQHLFMRSLHIYLTQSRHETLTCAQLCKGIDTRVMPCLPPDVEPTGLLQCLVYFIFNDFVNALVGNTFYVTEAEGKGMELFYFRKYTWFAIVRQHMASFQAQFMPMVWPENERRSAVVSPPRPRPPPIHSRSTSSAPSASSASSSVPSGSAAVALAAPPPRASREPPPSSTPTSGLFNDLLAMGKPLARSVTLPSSRPLHTLRTAAAHPPASPPRPVDGRTQSPALTRSTSMPGPPLPSLCAGKPVAPLPMVPTVRFVPKKHTVRVIANLRSRPSPHASPASLPTASLPTAPPSSTAPSASGKPDVVTNAQLYPCLHVLRALFEQRPELGGCGVFGADDIYRKLRAYKRRVDQAYPDPTPAGTGPDPDPRFYMAVLDVEKCYDNVCTHTVYDIVEHLLDRFTRAEPLDEDEDDEDEDGEDGDGGGRRTHVYSQLCAGRGGQRTVLPAENPILVHRYSITHAQQPSLARHPSSHLSIRRATAAAASRVGGPRPGPLPPGSFSKPVRYVSLTGDLISFPEAGPVLAQHFPDSILADHAVCNQLALHDLLRLLRCHLFGHVVRMPLPYKRVGGAKGAQHGSSYYSQVMGIPQGSVLSALLCTFYYGYVEHKVFGRVGEASPLPVDPLGLASGESLLLRCMDDYLLISLRAHYVQTFLHQALTTFRSAHNIRVNLGKVKVNFPVDIHAAGQDWSFRPASAEPELSWCGWRVDYRGRGLQIRPDFQRVVKLSRSLSSVSHLRGLKRAVSNWIRMKCHALILDTRVLNTKHTVWESIYQIFGVAAYRMGVSLEKLDKHQRGYVLCSDLYLMRCIRDCVVYGARLVQARRHSRILAQERSRMALLYASMHRMLQGREEQATGEDMGDDDLGAGEREGGKRSRKRSLDACSSGRGDDLPVQEVLLVAWSAFLYAAQRLSKHNIMRKASIRVWMEQQRSQLWEQTSLSEEDRETLRRLDTQNFLQ